MKKVRVSYQVANYLGVVTVEVEEDAHADHILIRAKMEVQDRIGTQAFPTYCKSFEILDT